MLKQGLKRNLGVRFAIRETIISQPQENISNAII